MTSSTLSLFQRAVALFGVVARALVLLPVHFYRAVLSPLKGAPTCRFLPTCSEYAVEAVRQRGVVVGSALTAWRIARCHPFCEGGYDPVPAAKRLAKEELG